MKKIVLLTLLISLYVVSSAQVIKLTSSSSHKAAATADEDLAYAFVDAPPGYVGGQERWLSYQRLPAL